MAFFSARSFAFRHFGLHVSALRALCHFFLHFGLLHVLVTSRFLLPVLRDLRLAAGFSSGASCPKAFPSHQG